MQSIKYKRKYASYICLLTIPNCELPSRWKIYSLSTCWCIYLGHGLYFSAVRVCPTDISELNGRFPEWNLHTSKNIWESVKMLIFQLRINVLSTWPSCITKIFFDNSLGILFRISTYHILHRVCNYGWGLSREVTF